MKAPFSLPLLALAAFTLLPLHAEPAKEQVATATQPDPAAAKARLAELDAYWSVVSKSVNTGDFDAYSATCHPEAVLVSGGKQMSQPLASALVRWQQEFTDTREGRIRASVEFRFSTRIGDATTAHETGIFLYTSQAADGPPKAEHIHFEALLVKKPDGWKILMENQKGPATEAEWQALK
jgi:ketosteroid isomerase-like protein